MRALSLLLVLLASTSAFAARRKVHPDDLKMAAQARSGTKFSFNRGKDRITITEGMVQVQSSWTVKGTRFTATLVQGTNGKRVSTRSSEGVKSGISTERSRLANGDIDLVRREPVATPAHLLARYPGMTSERLVHTVNGVVQPSKFELAKAAFEQLARQ